jgi:hypothetical protein
MSLLVSASMAFTLLLLLIAKPLALPLVRLLKGVALVPPIVWPAPPSKVTVPVPGVNVPAVIGPVTGDCYS